jgi:hypothetical protein
VPGDHPVSEPNPKTGKRPPVYVKEQAPWSAVRNAEHSCGFAAFIVDPGSHSGDFTTIEVTYYDVVNTVSWSRSKLSRSAVLAAARSDLVGGKDRTDHEITMPVVHGSARSEVAPACVPRLRISRSSQTVVRARASQKKVEARY